MRLGWWCFFNNSRVPMEQERVCRTVLELAEATGGGTLTSVGQSELTGATLVRLRVSENATTVLEGLRRRFPLGTASLVKNHLTGENDAQLLLPDAKDTERLASTLAHGAPVVLHLRRAVLALLALLLVRVVLKFFQ